MSGVVVVLGRELSAQDIGLIQGHLPEHPDWPADESPVELAPLFTLRPKGGLRLRAEARY